MEQVERMYENAVRSIEDIIEHARDRGDDTSVFEKKLEEVRRKYDEFKQEVGARYDV